MFINNGVGEFTMVSLVVGLVGSPGAGKEALFQNLKEISGYPVNRVSSSDILRSTLITWGIKPRRENFDRVFSGMVTAFGNDCLALAVQEQVARITQRSYGIVVIDSIRQSVDLEMLRRCQNNCLLFLDTSLQTRYKRAMTRRDPKDQELSFEQFKAQHQTQTERFVEEISAQADWCINNDGSIAELKTQITQFCNQQVRPLFIDQGLIAPRR